MIPEGWREIVVTKKELKVQSKFNILAKNCTSTYRILLRLDSKQYMKQIARQIGIKYTTLRNRVQKLELHGFIKRDFRTNFISYSLTKEGKELMPLLKKPQSAKISPPMNVRSTLEKEGYVRKNNLSYEFPILKDNLEAQWQEKNKHGTWYGYKDILAFPIGMTIVKHPNKIYVHFHQFRTEKKRFLIENMTYIMRGILYLEQYLRHKKGIEIDTIAGMTKSLEVANEMPEQEGNFDKAMKTSITLTRKAQALFPSEMKVKAWLDHSKGFPEIETNDLLYEEKLLLMPETIHKLEKQQDFMWQNQIKFAENLQTHLEVMQEMKETMKQIRDGLKK